MFSENPLACMFEKQIKFQELSNGTKFPKLDAEYVRYFSLGVIAELGEVLQAYKGWKPWEGSDSSMNKEQLSEELADLWKFIINLSLSLGYSAEDVHEAFDAKHKIILSRIEDK